MVARAVICDRPPSIDAHEVTDKGSINQRAVMAARPELVEDLYRDPPPPHVLVAKRRAEAMLVSRRDVEIEWGDCDPAGIVFYPRYFAMFDASTALLLERATGMKKIAWTKEYGIVGIPMVDTRAKFVVPSRYGDVIAIETRATKLGRTSFDVEHRVFRGEVLSIEAQETRVWAGKDLDHPDRIKGYAIPDEVARALSAD